MQFVGHDELYELAEQAAQTERRRKMMNLHQFSDKVQRMFNALHADTYVQPHRHKSPAKTETMLVLHGSLGIIEFNDDGDIKNTNIIGQAYDDFVVDIPAGIWHTTVSMEDDTIVFEAKEGPYDPSTDKEFASWAPSEDDEESVAYLEGLKQKLRINHED